MKAVSKTRVDEAETQDEALKAESENELKAESELPEMVLEKLDMNGVMKAAFDYDTHDSSRKIQIDGESMKQIWNGEKNKCSGIEDGQDVNSELIQISPNTGSKIRLWDMGKQSSIDTENGIIKDRKNRKVYLRVNIFDIMEVNTKAQAYKIRFYYEACWEYEDESDRYFDPKIGFKNIVDEAKNESHWVDIEPDYRKNGKPFICIRCKMTGTFAQTSDVRYFPFDVQAFIIQFRSDRSTDEMTLEVNTFRQSKFYGKLTTDYEFSFKKNGYYYLQSKSLGAGRKYFSEMGFLIKGFRKPGYYIYSLFVPIFLISTLGLTVFSVSASPEDFEVRFAVNGSILLTLVAYKFATSDLLPRVNYLTLTDKFILWSLSTQAIFIFWSSILISFVPADKSEFADKIFGYTVGGTWFIMAISCVAIFLRRKRRIKAYAHLGPEEIQRDLMFVDRLFPIETRCEKAEWKFIPVPVLGNVFSNHELLKSNDSIV